MLTVRDVDDAGDRLTFDVDADVSIGGESDVDPLGCLGQPCAQAFDEVGRHHGNAEPSTVLIDLRLALGPGE